MSQTYSLSSRLPGAIDRKQVWQGTNLNEIPFADHDDYSISFSDHRGTYSVEIRVLERGSFAETASRNESGYDTLRKTLSADGATVADALSNLSRKVGSLIGFHPATQDFIEALAIAAEQVQHPSDA